MHFCGASIISENWVVTAAHCVEGVQANNIRIHAGTTHQFVDNEGVFIDCDRVIIHPYYDSNSFDNDIALLHLASPLSFNSNIQPIRLNTDEVYNAVNMIARLTGWGTTQNTFNPDLNNNLQYVDLPIISREHAISINNEYIQLTSNMLPFFMGGSAAAQGDSGGPAAINIGSEYFLTGVCSWGLFPKDQNPTVYTKVSNYIDWIYSNILSISGPSTVCDQATYSIENLPSGATVEWSAGDNRLQLVSGQGTGTAVFRKNGNGKCFLTARIYKANNLLSELRKDLSVSVPGVYMYGDYLYDDKGNLKQFFTEYQPNPCVLQSDEDIDKWDWKITGGNISTSGLKNEYATIYPFSSSPPSFMIEIRALNQCGWTGWKRLKVNTRSSRIFSLSPNPAGEVVTLRLMETDRESGESILSTARSVYEIQLWSGMTMLRSYKTNEPTFQIPVAGLPAGLYFVRVVKDGEVHTEKLIKN